MRSIAQLKVGDAVAVVNLFGRRLATVTQVGQAGFAVGRRHYRWDGRGLFHSDSVAVLPEPDEIGRAGLVGQAGDLLPQALAG